MAVRRPLSADQRRLHESWDDIVRLVLQVLLVATLVWAAIEALRFAVHAATEALFGAVDQGGWLGPVALIAALLVGGLLRAALLRQPGWSDAAGDGMSVALDNYHITYLEDGDDPAPRYARPAWGFAARKFVATLITLASGASGGLEAPSVAISESIGAGWARVMRTASEYELRTYQLAAIAAGVATLLGAPFTAALFATEIAYGDRILYRQFAYALFAGVVAYILNNHVVGLEPLFVAPAHDRTYSLVEYGAVAVVAVVVSAPVALGFGLVNAQAGALVARVHPLWHGPAGAVASGLIALALWYGVGMEPRHVLGMGEHTLVELLDPHRHELLGAWWFLALAVVARMVTTSLTLQSGGSAGMLIPSMFLGGVSGALAASLIDLTGLLPALDPAVFVVAGIASALVAVIGVPLAAIALVLEVFGSSYGPPAILACGVTYVLTLRIAVYRSQRLSGDPVGDDPVGDGTGRA